MLIYYDMEFKRNIVCIDVETTGLNKATDRIIQLAMVKFNPNNGEVLENHNWYIIPSGKYTISEQATSVHGITKEILEEKGVKLSSIIDEFKEILNDSDILTYNGTTFDIAFIEREFEREGVNLDLDNFTFFDALSIERKFNSLCLSDVYKRYYGEGFEDVHDAFADVNATIKVFLAQLNKHGETQELADSIQETTTNTIISPEGFIKMENDVLVFSVGKYKGFPVSQICQQDPDYIKWLWSGSNGDKVITSPTKKAIVEDWNKFKKSL